MNTKIQIKPGSYDPSQLQKLVQEAQSNAPEPQPPAQQDTYTPSSSDDYWTQRAHEPYKPHQ